MTSSPGKGHNKGPIGPLDPNEPPPWEPELKRDDVLDEGSAIAALRSMGVEIEKTDFDYWAATGSGPPHSFVATHRKYHWGALLDSLAHLPRPPVITREQAVEYLQSLGWEGTEDTVRQLASGGKGPPYIRLGRQTFYKPEELEEWYEDRKARKVPPPSFYAPKYKPRDAQRRCPADHTLCGTVKHSDCEKYARALCHFTHLPERRDR
jgi:hypothetical protein